MLRICSRALLKAFAPRGGCRAGQNHLSQSLHHAATFGRPARQVDDASDGGAGLNVNGCSGLFLRSGCCSSLRPAPLCGPAGIPDILCRATPKSPGMAGLVGGDTLELVSVRDVVSRAILTAAAVIPAARPQPQIMSGGAGLKAMRRRVKSIAR